MRKPALCICENKATDQLRSNIDDIDRTGLPHYNAILGSIEKTVF